MVFIPVCHFKSWGNKVLSLRNSVLYITKRPLLTMEGLKGRMFSPCLPRSGRSQETVGQLLTSSVTVRTNLFSWAGGPPPGDFSPVSSLQRGGSTWKNNVLNTSKGSHHPARPLTYSHITRTTGQRNQRLFPRPSDPLKARSSTGLDSENKWLLLGTYTVLDPQKENITRDWMLDMVL